MQNNGIMTNTYLANLRSSPGGILSSTSAEELYVEMERVACSYNFSDGLKQALFCQVIFHKCVNSHIVGRIHQLTDGKLSYQVAACPKTSERLLDKLAKHDNISVRAAVARNPNTPLDTLLVLLSEETSRIREAVLINPNLPSEIKFRYNLER